MYWSCCLFILFYLSPVMHWFVYLFYLISSIGPVYLFHLIYLQLCIGPIYLFYLIYLQLRTSPV